ncbi:unnamed protein product [Musa textilis]
MAMNFFKKQANKSNKYNNTILSPIINASHSGCISTMLYSLLCTTTSLVFPNIVHNDPCNLSCQDNPVITFNHNMHKHKCKQDNRNK